MNDTTFTIIIGVILLFMLFVLPQIRLRRDIPSLIRIFREARAVGVKNAKTIEELRLEPPSGIRSFIRGSDHMQNTLRELMKANIIKSTEDGRMYLSEGDLASSKWRDK